MAVVPIDHEAIKNIKPPVNQRGIIGWFKENLFNGIFNSVLTLIILTFILKFLPPFIQWAFFKASWFTNPDVCKQCEGACWSVVFKNLRFIIFGFYPHDIHWRPFAAMMILFLLLFFSSNRRFWTKKLAYAWPVGLVAMGVLMKGGILGLAPVDSMKWGDCL
jgi:general L-amino acid transport system permease protein